MVWDVVEKVVDVFCLCNQNPKNPIITLIIEECIFFVKANIFFETSNQNSATAVSFLIYWSICHANFVEKKEDPGQSEIRLRRETLLYIVGICFTKESMR